MSTLSDITSKDSHRIWLACGAIRHLRDAVELRELIDNLDLIRSSTRGVPLGGRLLPNSRHLEFAIRKLEYIANAEGCLCALYLIDEFADPEREAREGNVTRHEEPLEK